METMEKMQLQKDAKRYLIFERSYWSYFLELEEQFLATKRYVAFDVANYKSYSLEYLKLLEAVCSEIDVVGKEIAHQVHSDFKIKDNSANIQKWWFIIQDWYAEDGIESVKILDELEFSPWTGFRIEEYADKNGAKRLRLAENSKTPYWWTSYNKVKHNRTLSDPDTQEQYFHRANLENLCNAFSALYLLEKKYRKSVGRAEEYNRCQISKLFEKEKPTFFYAEKGYLCQYIEGE